MVRTVLCERGVYARPTLHAGKEQVKSCLSRHLEVYMLRVCAWCKCFLGQKEPLEDRTVTHSICDWCKYQNLLPVEGKPMVVGLQPLKFPKVYPTCDVCQTHEVGSAIEWRDSKDTPIKRIRVCVHCLRDIEAGEESDFVVVPINPHSV